MMSYARAGAARRAGELEARNVANILHGFATMGHHPGDSLLAACAAQAVERMREATAQNVANTVWSFATLQHNPGDALLAACAAQAHERIWEASPQNLANTVWSFATLQNHPGAALLQNLEAAAVRSAAAFNPQTVVCDTLRCSPRSSAVHLQQPQACWHLHRAAQLLVKCSSIRHALLRACKAAACKCRNMQSLACCAQSDVCMQGGLLDLGASFGHS